MKKKILVTVTAFLILAMMLTPLALAKPTKGQKEAVTVTMVATGPPADLDDPRLTGPVTHFHWLAPYAVTIEIEGGATLGGTIVQYRKLVTVPQKEGYRWIFTDYYEITILTEDGELIGSDCGFEGNAKVILDGVFMLPSFSYDKGRGSGLFHGTGTFEGQTLNVDSDGWQPMGPIIWRGYLKP